MSSDEYDRIYGYGSEIAEALRQDDAIRAARAARPTVTKVEPPREEPPRQQQQHYNATVPLDEATKKWNEWFEGSFNNCMRPHTESLNRSLDVIRKFFDDVGDAFDDVHGETSDIIKVLSSEKKDADGKYILPHSLDVVIARLRTEMRAEIATILKQHNIAVSDSNASVLKTLDLVDEILAA